MSTFSGFPGISSDPVALPFLGKAPFRRLVMALCDDLRTPVSVVVVRPSPCEAVVYFENGLT